MKSGKGNYIDVYYNGGAILKLSYSNGLIRGEIHFKYVPLTSENNYVPLTFRDDKVEIHLDRLHLGDVSDFSEEVIHNIQERIDKFYPPSSEKGIQADFVLKDSCFLDTEFEYAHEGKNIRFDLVWVNVETHKIYVVELKTIEDQRLRFNEKSHNSAGYDKIDAQLLKYGEFIRRQNRNLISHYEIVLTVKKQLGILRDGLLKLDSLNDFTFEERPILLIGDCTQAWIDNNRNRLNDSLKNIAYGCFYQGRSTRKFYVPRETTGNKHVFVNG